MVNVDYESRQGDNSLVHVEARNYTLREVGNIQNSKRHTPNETLECIPTRQQRVSSVLQDSGCSRHQHERVRASQRERRFKKKLGNNQLARRQRRQPLIQIFLMSYREHPRETKGMKIKRRGNRTGDDQKCFTYRIAGRVFFVLRRRGRANIRLDHGHR